MAKLPLKYEVSRAELMLAAMRGTAQFRTTIERLWAQCRPPFQVLNPTGSERSSGMNPPDGCLWGDPIQVKRSHANSGMLYMPAVAFSDQMTHKIATDPLIPSDLDSITPQNWEPIFAKLCEYQIEADSTIRKGAEHVKRSTISRSR